MAAGKYDFIIEQGTTIITFQQENAGSLASNRFVLGVSNKTINQNQSATFVYATGLTIGGVANSARWVLTATT